MGAFSIKKVLASKSTKFLIMRPMVCCIDRSFGGPGRPFTGIPRAAELVPHGGPKWA